MSAAGGWARGRGAGGRRARGRGGSGLGAATAPGAAGDPGSQSTFPARVPALRQRSAEAAAAPPDGSGDLCLRTGAGGRRGSPSGRAGERSALRRGEQAAGATGGCDSVPSANASAPSFLLPQDS